MSRGKENPDKNKAIVLLKKVGMPMKEIVRAFEKSDKRNFYRVWRRDKNKYFIKNGNNQPTTSSRSTTY